MSRTGNEEKIQGIERELTRLESVIEETKNNKLRRKIILCRIQKQMKNHIERRRAGFSCSSKAEADFTRVRAVINSEMKNSKDDIISLSNKNITRKADISILENYKQRSMTRKKNRSEEYSGKDAD